MLSDIRITRELEAGRIVIEPFSAAQLGTNSYDVRLGNYFYVPNPAQNHVNFFDEASAKAYWCGPLYKADDEYIDIQGGETILAHTYEIIGGRAGITTSMRARSSIGRSCLSVCKCAGVGDVGYINRWTMEISNHGRATVRLPVGVRVAQMLFFDVGPTNKHYAGKYGQKAWKPWDMLPKLYLDTDYGKGEHNNGTKATNG